MVWSGPSAVHAFAKAAVIDREREVRRSADESRWSRFGMIRTVPVALAVPPASDEGAAAEHGPRPTAVIDMEYWLRRVRRRGTRIAWAWARRNSGQVGRDRCGGGSIPAAVRIF
jgi:hypothetical protein